MKAVVLSCIAVVVIVGFRLDAVDNKEVGLALIDCMSNGVVV